MVHICSTERRLIMMDDSTLVLLVKGRSVPQAQDQCNQYDVMYLNISQRSILISFKELLLVPGADTGLRKGGGPDNS